MNRTYKYRLYPTKTQAAQLDRVFSVAWRVYNDIHHMRKTDYFDNGVKWTWQALAKEWRKERNANALLQLLPASTVAELVRRHDKAMKAFFARRNEGVGYPNEKKRRDFRGLEYRYEGKYLNIMRQGVAALTIPNVGVVNVRFHRPLPVGGTIKQMVIGHTRRDHWYVCLQIDIPATDPQPMEGETVGIDIGIAYLLALSNGETVENPRWYAEAKAKRRVIQRQLDRQRRAANPDNYQENGTVKENAVIWRKSNRQCDVERQLATLEDHVAQQRWYFWHTLTDNLTKRFSLIALEDLTLDFMIQNKRLAMPAHDASFATFWQMLKYKAEERGVKLVFVPPAYTSQRCAECGHIESENRKSQANFTCVACGHQNNADLNAARNILHLALQAPVQGVRGLTKANGSSVPREAQKAVPVATDGAV